MLLLQFWLQEYIEIYWYKFKVNINDGTVLGFEWYPWAAAGNLCANIKLCLTAITRLT